jgi:uncharacterized protein
MESRLTIAPPARNWINDALTPPANDKIAGRVFGYTAVFYNPSDPGTEYNLKANVWERIGRHAFDRAIREKHNVRCQINHDSNYLMGTTGDGSVMLKVDRRGLFFECFAADTQPSHDAVELIKRGSIRGCSFQFNYLDEIWSREGDKVIVELTDLELYDVGPVVWPAYESTPVAARDENRRYAQESVRWEHFRAAEADLLMARMPQIWVREIKVQRQRDRDRIAVADDLTAESLRRSEEHDRKMAMLRRQ